MSAPKASINWTLPGRTEALFAQIISVGQSAFLTHKANVKEDKTRGIEAVIYSQKDVWTNPTNGIITMLKMDTQLFKDVVWPQSHDSILQSVLVKIKNNSHLYTAGREQDEPADAGTSETKDERPLTELEQAIIEVAALKKAADATTAANQAGRETANEMSGKGAQFFQDAQVSRKYGGFSASDFTSKGRRGKSTMGTRKSRDGYEMEDDDAPEPGTRKRPATHRCRGCQECQSGS